MENNTIIGKGCCLNNTDLKGCICIGEDVSLPDGSENKILIDLPSGRIEGDIPEGFAREFGKAIQGCKLTWK